MLVFLFVVECSLLRVWAINISCWWFLFWKHVLLIVFGCLHLLSKTRTYVELILSSDHHSKSTQNDSLQPVWKHGPRSLTIMRVFVFLNDECVAKAKQLLNTSGASFSSEEEYTRSIIAGTRKMVNYAWTTWSQAKAWWRSANGSDVQIDREILV